MFRILISFGDAQTSERVFEQMREIVKVLRIKSEVFWSVNHEMIRKRLIEDPNYYDIFILDGLDTQCLRTAALMRKGNLISTLILFAKRAPNIHKVMPLRPSFLISGAETEIQLKNAIAYSYNEQLRAHPYFMVKNKDMLIRINYSDILWFESKQRTVILRSRKREISFYAKLTDLLPMLPQDQFIRCHQSFIVNADQVEWMDKTRRCLCMATKDEIEISRSYYPQVAAYMDAHR